MKKNLEQPDTPSKSEAESGSGTQLVREQVDIHKEGMEKSHNAIEKLERDLSTLAADIGELIEQEAKMKQSIKRLEKQRKKSDDAQEQAELERDIARAKGWMADLNNVIDQAYDRITDLVDYQEGNQRHIKNLQQRIEALRGPDNFHISEN